MLYTLTYLGYINLILRFRYQLKHRQYTLVYEICIYLYHVL